MMSTAAWIMNLGFAASAPSVEPAAERCADMDFDNGRAASMDLDLTRAANMGFDRDRAANMDWKSCS